MRALNLAVLGLTVIAATAQAGTITQIGGVNGLTTAYVTGNCGGACVTGSIAGTVTPTEVNYNSSVFAGATNGATAPTPYAGYSASADSVATLTDSINTNVVFSMINEGSGSSNADAWRLQSGGATSSAITIPVGIFGVTSIWTMTNTLTAAAAARDVTLLLTFGSTATTGTGTTVVTIRPINTNTPASSTVSGTERNAVSCSSGAGCTGTTAGGANGAVGPPVDPYVTSAGTSAGGVSSTGGTTGLNGINIAAHNLYTFAYDTITTGVYASTAGNLYLDDQGYQFTGTLASFALGQYLQSVTVRANGSSANTSAYLSALTVDSVPEPSTWVLLLSGIAVAGVARFRTRLKT